MAESTDNHLGFHGDQKFVFYDDCLHISHLASDLFGCSLSLAVTGTGELWKNVGNRRGPCRVTVAMTSANFVVKSLMILIPRSRRVFAIV